MPRLIDADALLAEDLTGSFVDAYDNAIFEAIIEKAPTIDPASLRTKGEWISVEDEEQPCDEWDCTACGQRRTFLCEMDADDMKENYPFCPNCGADMRGGAT